MSVEVSTVVEAFEPGRKPLLGCRLEGVIRTEEDEDGEVFCGIRQGKLVGMRPFAFS